MRQLLGRVLLAVALAVAQYGVYAHALSHFDEALHGHDGDARLDHDRGVCVGFAAVSGGALTSGDLRLDAHVAPQSRPGTRPTDPLLAPLALTRFASRAPPLSR
jgi:hypothetical protein